MVVVVVVVVMEGKGGGKKQGVKDKEEEIQKILSAESVSRKDEKELGETSRIQTVEGRDGDEKLVRVMEERKQFD